MRRFPTTAHIIRLILAISALSAYAGAARAAPDNKRVLLLFTNESHQAGATLVEDAIRSTLQSGSPKTLEIYSEYMDALRTPIAKYDKELVEYLKRKYGDKKFDVILCVNAPALQFALQHRDSIFANTPVVFLILDHQNLSGIELPANVTGVWGETNYRATLDMALSLHPGTKRVVVITGVGEWDKFWRGEVQRQFETLSGTVEFSYLTGLTIPEQKTALASLPPQTIVMYVSSTQDRNGENFSNLEVLKQIAPSSRVPMYGGSDAQLGLGIVGGKLLSLRALGEEGGRVGLRVLAGETPGQIPTHGIAGVAMFDWRELNRWGLNEKSLPPNSVVMFKEASLWEEYKWTIIGLIIAVIVEGLLIGQLLNADRRRRRAEQKSRHADKRLREIVSNVPGMVWETVIDPDTKERKTTFVSDYVRKMLGYTPEEWLAEPPGFGLRLMADEDRERARADSEAAIASGTESISEHRWRAKDGRLLWIESHLGPIVNGTGESEGLRGVSLDITERKLAEDSLRESEERSRRAQQAARVGTWEWNVRTGESVWSDMIWELLGLEKSEDAITVENFLNAIHVDDRERVREKVNSLLTSDNGDHYDEFRVVHPDGKVLWLASNGRLFRANDGTPERMIGVNIDITKRKLAEEVARITQEKEAAVLNAIPDLMFVQTRDGVYLDYHTTDKEQLLVPPEEYLGKNMNEILPPDLAKKFSHYFERAFETGETQIVEYALTIQGRERWYEARLVTSGENILSVVRDITERKRSLDQLRESEERFGKAFRSNPQPMSLTTLVDGVYIDVNESFLVMSGYARKELIGHSSLALGVWVERERRALFMKQLVEKGSLSNIETIFRTKNGSERILLSSAERLEIGGQDCVLIASSDITERMAAQEALRESEARYRQMAENAAQANAELVVAHEEVQRLKDQLEEENIYLQEEIRLAKNIGEMVGESDAIKYVMFKVSHVAVTDSTVLITGETGTGKELVARAIHSSSARSDRALITVNCAALPATLIESELFGHEKGAFTGANTKKLGRFELADGGTIFLDEVGEMPVESQVKLLRVLQEGEVHRLGGGKPIKVDVRIITATNKDLRREIERGAFREDLWYRLNVFPITVPPLRQRTEDIPLLVEHFVAMYASKFGKSISEITPQTMQQLKNHSWPGNIRELANVIERAVIYTQGNVLNVVDVFEQSKDQPASSEGMKSLEEVEREYIVHILEHTSWRIEGPRGAAKLLGMNPSTLRTRMIKLGIHKNTAKVNSH